MYAVYIGYAVRFQRLAMRACGITHMAFKSKMRIFVGKTNHVQIARHFSDDAGSADGWHGLVGLNNRLT